MGSNAAKGTCQIWISRQVHEALTRKSEQTRRFLRAEAEEAIAVGLGFESIHDLEKHYPLDFKEEAETKSETEEAPA